MIIVSFILGLDIGFRHYINDFPIDWNAISGYNIKFK